LATKKSIWAIIGLILILAVWEVNGTLIERHNVLHEEGADVTQPAAGQSAAPQSAIKAAVSGHTDGPQLSSATTPTTDAHGQH
jgi:hypothetical protein